MLVLEECDAVCSMHRHYKKFIGIPLTMTLKFNSELYDRVWRHDPPTSISSLSKHQKLTLVIVTLGLLDWLQNSPPGLQPDGHRLQAEERQFRGIMLALEECDAVCSMYRRYKKFIGIPFSLTVCRLRKV